MPSPFDFRKLPTNIFGLKWQPTIEPDLSDDADAHWQKVAKVFAASKEVTESNRLVIRYEMIRLGGCHCIVEIGVCRSGKDSFTHVLLNDKPDGCVYLGVDLQDKSSLDDPDKNVHTIKVDSKERQLIFSKMQDLGHKEIDLLLIDGWHSVNMAINDWQYIERLSPHGVVVLHDTNFHPGPSLLFDAVDEELFDKRKHCRWSWDHGIAVFRRKQ